MSLGGEYAEKETRRDPGSEGFHVPYESTSGAEGRGYEGTRIGPEIIRRALREKLRPREYRATNVVPVAASHISRTSSHPE